MPAALRRTLLLDLDGTLVDSVPDLRASLNRLAARRELEPFDAAAVTAMVGDGVPALVRKAFAARGREATAADIADFTADYTAQAAVDTRPYPGAAETLAALRRDGWRMGVCTNKPEAAARALLATLGLLPSFDALAGGDSQPVRKPDPGHPRHLLTLLGASAAEAVMVGDHHNDVLAARAAGIPCIFAAWGYGTVKMAEGSVATAASFAALPAALARIG